MDVYETLESRGWFCYSGSGGDLFRHAKIPGVRISVSDWSCVDFRRKSIVYPRGCWRQALAFQSHEDFIKYIDDSGDFNGRIRMLERQGREAL